MRAADKEIILYLRQRSEFYGLRAKQLNGKLADRDRAISRAYRDDARELEEPTASNEVPAR